MKNKETSVSTDIVGNLTFGHGKLSHSGYWEFPDYKAARKYEKKHPGTSCWPFKKESIVTKFQHWISKHILLCWFLDCLICLIIGFLIGRFI